MATITETSNYSVVVPGASVLTRTTTYSVSGSGATVTGTTTYSVNTLKPAKAYVRVGGTLQPVRLGKRRGSVIDWLV